MIRNHVEVDDVDDDDDNYHDDNDHYEQASGQMNERVAK